MSVIVRRFKSNTMEVYVKGAPEVMGDICEKDSCMMLDRTPFFGAHLVTGSPTGLRRSALLLHSVWLSRNCCRGKEYRRSFLAQSSADETVRFSQFLDDTPSYPSQASKLRAVFASSDWLYLRTS